MSISVTCIVITSLSDLAVYAGKERHEPRYIAGRVRQCLARESMARESGKLLFERVFG
jgi:hypothetical protein